MKISTEQQEAAHKVWVDDCIDSKAEGVETLPFQQWYMHHCIENGLFNDCNSVLCDCGHTVNKGCALNASLGTSCIDCYDECSY